MGIVMALVLGLVFGGLIGVLYGRRARSSDAGGPAGAVGQGARGELARAWQEGYDAGSVASAAPVTGAPVGSEAAPPAVHRQALHHPAPPAPHQSVPHHPAPPAPTPTLPPMPVVPAISPQEQAEAKERRDRRNVNITLYTACLLLVAAASLFIGAALPATARLAGLAVVVGLFYAGGLVVHAVSRTLRPAATAFTGTGLALLPVAGVALDLLVVHRPEVSWLLTSAVGTVLMVVAALRLDSRVVAYLTVPFLLSTVMASGAAVQQGMAWALIASIGLAVLMAWLSVDAEDRHPWLPPAYREATARTHQWIVPGAVAAGLLLGVWIEPVQMFLLLLAACAYYATVAVIGPPRYRLASVYAVRGGLLLALIAWAVMLEWSVSVTLTVLVVYLCLQIPLARWGRGAQGYLPAGTAALTDHGISWVLAVLSALAAQIWVAGLAWSGLRGAAGAAGAGGGEGAGYGEGAGGAVLELVPGLGWPAVLVVVTTAVYSLVFLRAVPAVEVAPLVWQATTPLSTVPLLVYAAAAGGPERVWNLEILLAVALVMQALILVVLRRSGQRHRIDARIAPHVMAAAAVALVYLLTDRTAERWTAGWADGWATGWAEASPAVVAAALASLAWATVTALRRGPLTGSGEDSGSAGGGDPRGAGVSDGTVDSGGAGDSGGTGHSGGVGLPVGVWTGASLLALVLLLGVEVSGAAHRVGWYVLAVVTGAVALWWLGRGIRAGVEQRVDTARWVILGVGAASLSVTTVRFAGAGGPGSGIWSWHVVIALGLLTGWLVTAAVVTKDRLSDGVRTAVLLAGQGASAVLVSTVTDRLGGDGSAARAAAAAALVAGLALRQRLARRLPGADDVAGPAGPAFSGAGAGAGAGADAGAGAVTGLNGARGVNGGRGVKGVNGRLASWLVTGAVALLWLIELGAGGDRAALMVVAAALIAAGLVLRTRSGGHWAVLVGAPALVVAASPWFDLDPTGGWLPEALFPTSAAVALLVLLVLAVAAQEIAAAVRGPAGGPDAGLDAGPDAGRDAGPDDGRDAGRDAGNASGPTSGGEPWWADLGVFRLAAIVFLGVASLVLGLTGDVDGTPHAGALAMTVAAGGLVGYVLARTRGLAWLVVGTVVGVPSAVWLLTMWWQDRGLWFPDGDWRAVGSALVALVLLGGWAILDARGVRDGDGSGGGSVAGSGVASGAGAGAGSGAVVATRAAILWQGALAVVLVTALATVLDVGLRAGMPEDAAVWTSLAAAVAALWLTMDAWGRTLLWPGARGVWVLNGRDVAVVLTWAAVSRAWWQTAVVDDPGRAGWWNVQLLVLVLVGLGYWHLRRPDLESPEAGGVASRRPLWCFLAAALVFTLAATYVLADGTAGMQLTVLVGFALMVVLGLTRREQSLTWWGAGGVALSVLWYLRGYTYIYLALLGLVLIVLAVRQLRRHQSRQEAEPNQVVGGTAGERVTGERDTGER
ncbi:hypothetical protein AB0K08_15825 [Citricoccus sp. NPDC055426]|uniref:hypothetical protein n=1 Tax=Citricoccus sp. NPDC055426 TaxID=3155536 RepID=UPI003427928B